MLLRLPESWPPPVVAVLAMTALALLDLGGTFAAKEAVERRSWVAAAIGVTLFALLFWIFASSLQYAELAPVTFGWVVILQVGVLLLDRVKYGVELPAGKWVAVGVLLLAQAYLLLGPDKPAEPAAPPAAVTLAEIRLPDDVPAPRLLLVPRPRDGGSVDDTVSFRDA